MTDEPPTLPQDTPPSRVAELVRQIAATMASDPHSGRLVSEAALAVEELVVADEELRVQAEELAASRDAVDQERERYADLFEMLPDAVIETDEHGKILEANEAAARLLGVPIRSMRGKLLISFVRAEDRKRLRRLIAQHGGRRDEPMLRIFSREGTETLVAVSFSRRVRPAGASVLWALRDLSYLAEIDRLGATVEELGQLVGLQRLIGDPDPLGPMIERIFVGAATVLPGFELVVRFDQRGIMRGSSEIASALVAAETAHGEGPTHDAIAEVRAVEASSLALGRRWPTVGKQAVTLGVQGVCGVPVTVDGDPVGAIVAWRIEKTGGQGVLPFLALMAEHLGIAHANGALYRDIVEHGLNLERALVHRGVIERAKGMLVHARGVTADEAFAILRAESQHTNRKLRDVALDVAEGRLPVQDLRLAT